MMYGLRSRDQVKNNISTLFVDQHIFPQTLAVLRTRMGMAGIEIEVGDYNSFDADKAYFGAIVQYPNSNGNVEDYRNFVENTASDARWQLLPT